MGTLRSAPIGKKGKVFLLGRQERDDVNTLLLIIHYPTGEFPEGEGWLNQVFTEGVVGRPSPMDPMVEGMDGLMVRAKFTGDFYEQYVHAIGRMLQAAIGHDVGD